MPDIPDDLAAAGWRLATIRDGRQLLVHGRHGGTDAGVAADPAAWAHMVSAARAAQRLADARDPATGRRREARDAA